MKRFSPVRNIRDDSNRVYPVIFLVSASVLIFEVSITRLFSIYLSYHFAFMVISIAMLGIGSAGTALSIFPLLRNTSNISIYAMLSGATIVMSYIASNYIPFDPVKLSWDNMQIFYVAMYCLVLSIPFFFAGMLIASAFSVLSEKSDLVYGSDLLGAGTGSLAVLLLLNVKGPEYAILTASTICFIAALIAGRHDSRPAGKKRVLTALVLIAVNMLILILHPGFINVRISPYKNLPLFLKYPGSEHLKTYHNSYSRIDTFKSPAVRFAPGLSFTYLEPLPEQVGISTDGGEVSAVTDARNKEALAFLKYLPSSLAYEIKHAGTGRVLVLEPEAGLQALMARYYDFQSVHKVESNPLLLEIIQGDFKEFSGEIFEHDTWSGLGRSLLHGLRVTGHGSRAYDIIDLPMTNISVTGTFGISEDYRFTVEAFNEYLGALKNDGLMSISLYIIPPPRTEFRILGTVITALEQTGIKHVSQHITAIRSWDSITMLFKKTPFNQEEILNIKEFAKRMRFDLVHYPGIQERETNQYVRMPSNEYFSAFKSIINSETRQMFFNDYLFDIEPVDDENPFFNFHLKLENIKAIYELMGHKWQYFIEEGYMLPVVFIEVLILSVLMILLPVFYKTRFKQCKQFELFTLFYFAMLGAGFMLVEVTLIQKSILLLENSAYSVATVLTAILIGSGIGGLNSSKFAIQKTCYLLPVLTGLILLYSFVFPELLNYLSPYPLKLKILITFISLIPLGYFMGIPFPAGIKMLGQADKILIPWAWAINGCMSVLAPMLAIMLAMALGFKTVLWFGASAYLLAFFALKKLIRE